jgi:hypothetical protein
VKITSMEACHSTCGNFDGWPMQRRQRDAITMMVLSLQRHLGRHAEPVPWWALCAA